MVTVHIPPLPPRQHFIGKPIEFFWPKKKKRRMDIQNSYCKTINLKNPARKTEDSARIQLRPGWCRLFSSSCLSALGGAAAGAVSVPGSLRCLSCSRLAKRSAASLRVWEVEEQSPGAKSTAQLKGAPAQCSSPSSFTAAWRIQGHCPPIQTLLLRLPSRARQPNPFSFSFC